jgi:hypothetical protein
VKQEKSLSIVSDDLKQEDDGQQEEDKTYLGGAAAEDQIKTPSSSDLDILYSKRTKKSFRKLQIPQEFSQRQDVVLKTILRMIRRYFVNQFNV